MNIEGFLLVIINIAPVNVPLLLGLADEDQPFDPVKEEGQRERLSYLEPVNRLEVRPSRQVSLLN
jgi:hypothetical protein